MSGTKYRVSTEGVGLMDETNNLAKQVGRSPADKFAGANLHERSEPEGQGQDAHSNHSLSYGSRGIVEEVTPACS